MYRCPKCHSSEILVADARVDASLNASGALESRDSNLRVESHSRVDCGVCGHHGALEAFSVATPPTPGGSHENQ